MLICSSHADEKKCSRDRSENFTPWLCGLFRHTSQLVQLVHEVAGEHAGHAGLGLRSMDDELSTVEIPLHDPHSGAPNERHVSTYAALHNETVVIDDVYGESRFDLSGTRRFDSDSGFHTVSMLTVPDLW